MKEAHTCAQASEDNFEKIIDQYWKVSHDTSPKELFHYCGAESIRSILESDNMWASAFECMNDDQEFRHGFKIADEEIQNSILALPISNKTEILESWNSFFSKENSQPSLRPFVLSFSQTNRNQYLWTNYATDSGACLRLTNNSKGNDLINGYLVEVGYDKEIARLHLKSYLQDLTSHFSSNTCDSCLKTNLRNLFFAFLRSAFRLAVSIKEKKWESEKEWRLLVFAHPESEPQSSHGNIKFRTRGINLIDYLQIDLSRACLKILEVELGGNFPESSKNSVRLLVLKKPPIRITK